IAPAVVATSRNMPMPTLENPSRTYAAAAPDEVAMTEMSDTPIAYRMSTWKKTVSSGTSSTPPPSPVSAPRSPAVSDPKKRRPVNIDRVIGRKNLRKQNISQGRIPLDKVEQVDPPSY